MNAWLTLYSRVGCHLCERAEDLLAEHAPNCQVVDVDADEDLRTRYGLRVPVLVCGETVLLEGKFAEADVLGLLSPDG